MLLNEYALVSNSSGIKKFLVFILDKNNLLSLDSICLGIVGSLPKNKNSLKDIFSITDPES